MLWYPCDACPWWAPSSIVVHLSSIQCSNHLFSFLLGAPSLNFLPTETEMSSALLPSSPFTHSHPSHLSISPSHLYHLCGTEACLFWYPKKLIAGLTTSWKFTKDKTRKRTYQTYQNCCGWNPHKCPSSPWIYLILLGHRIVQFPLIASAGGSI